MSWSRTLIVLVSASLLGQLLPAQFAKFDAAYREFVEADAAGRQAKAANASGHFLRLADSAGRTERLPAGATVALAAGQAELALELASPTDPEKPQTQETLLTVQLRALAQLGRLTEFARIVKRQAATQPRAVGIALAAEERTLQLLAARALRTPDRPWGRLVFQHLATLEPIQSYRVANLGLCLRQIGDVKAAFQTYELGRRIAPDDLELWNDYGLLLRATGKHDEAVAAFERSVALDLARDEKLSGTGPGITNLMHLASLYPDRKLDDPMPTAILALSKRRKATMLTRLTLDVALDRLQAGDAAK